MRPGRFLAAGFLVLAVSMGLSLAQAPADVPSACAGEPGAGTDLRARLIGLQDTGIGVRVAIDLGVRPEMDLSGGRIQGHLRRFTDGARVLDLPPRSLSIPKGNRVFLRYDLDVTPGEDYEMTFILADAESTGALSSTTLRINLDPARSPRILDNRLQYRAQMQGR